MSEFGGEEIQFPVLCHYKIIADRMDGVKPMIEKKLQDMGVVNPLNDGTVSANGKYISYDIDIKVASKDFMKKIDDGLRSIPHVRMVM